MDGKPFRELPALHKAAIIAMLAVFYGAFFYICALYYGWIEPPTSF